MEKIRLKKDLPNLPACEYTVDIYDGSYLLIWNMHWSGWIPKKWLENKTWFECLDNIVEFDNIELSWSNHRWSTGIVNWNQKLLYSIAENNYKVDFLWKNRWFEKKARYNQANLGDLNEADLFCFWYEGNTLKLKNVTDIKIVTRVENYDIYFISWDKTGWVNRWIIRYESWYTFYKLTLID